MNNMLALMGTSGIHPFFGAFLGGTELIVVFGAILVLFGAKKIPEFAKGLGQGIKEFKKASKDVTDEFQNAVNQDTYTPPPQRSLPPAPQQHQLPSSAEAVVSVPASTVPKG